jgi:hypothetical protein
LVVVSAGVSVTDSETVVSSEGREDVVSEIVVLSAAAICDSITSLAPVGWLPTLLPGLFLVHPVDKRIAAHDIRQIALFIMTSIRKKAGIRLIADAGFYSQLSASLSTS